VRLLYTGVFAVALFLGASAVLCWRPMGALYPAWTSTSSSRSSWWSCWAVSAAWRHRARRLIYGELKSLGILLVPDLESVFIYVPWWSAVDEAPGLARQAPGEQP